MNNDLSADLKSKTATINTFTLRMPSSNAIKLNLKGRIVDWEKQRQLEELGRK